MKNANITLTFHALKQYQDRVKLIDRATLSIMCQKQYDEGEYEFRRGRLILLGDVWYVYKKRSMGNRLFLVTCYGRSHLDMPEAIIWARRNNDRIDLKHL